VARWLGVTSDEAALPAPLVEPVILNRLGAETMQFPVRPGDAVEGHPVRELGLPREALLNVIVRGDRAIPPRGSTMIEAGERLHLLVRQEAAVELRQLAERWRSGPIDVPVRRRPGPAATLAPLTSGPWREGDAARPEMVAGTEVAEQLRTRRDGTPGALVALADGRFAFTGPVYAAGALRHVRDAAQQRLGRATDDAERAWWREVVGALAAPEDRVAR
jgi:cell volume regulation protein A